jgi:hypothetical protein
MASSSAKMVRQLHGDVDELRRHFEDLLDDRSGRVARFVTAAASRASIPSLNRRQSATTLWRPLTRARISQTLQR